MTILEMLFRVLLGFLILLTASRIMGRKEISQITFFNFVSTIALGSMGGTFVISKSVSIRNGIIAFVAWTLITLFVEFFTIKSRKARKVIAGEPVIVVKDGKIVEAALKKCRLDINSLSSLLRKKNIFSMADVDYAIFETDGQLSVLKKDRKQSVTKGDVNIVNQTKKIFPLATELISDGTLLYDNLKKLNLTEDWLTMQLQQANIGAVTDVFYAEVQQDGTIFISEKSKNN